MISYRNVSLTAYSFLNCIVKNITNAKEEVQGKIIQPIQFRVLVTFHILQHQEQKLMLAKL